MGSRVSHCSRSMNGKITFLLLSLGFLGLVEESIGLSCPPCNEEIQRECPKPPSCCASGSYMFDVCGCCRVCAQPKNEKCGGPWNTAGSCGPNLSCLRSCQCKTNGYDERDEEAKPCVFPFRYQGKTYNECTTDHSVNEEPWCATEINPRTSEVIRGKWGDCSRGCPGTGYICQEHDLFNMKGRCIDNAQSAVRLLPADVPHQLDPGVTNDGKNKAPLCQGGPQ